MDESASVVYQSGQVVSVAGSYELASGEPKPEGANREEIIREMNVGELFPDYEGRSCAWHPVASEAQTSTFSTP